MIDLIQGDCLEKMKDIPNGSIDMILCDLPYGVTAYKWDIAIPFESLWEQYNRIIKDNGAIVLFGVEPFSSKLRMSNLKNYKYDWIWYKNGFVTGFLNSRKKPLKTYEVISVFYKKQPTYNPQKSKGHKPYINKRGTGTKVYHRYESVTTISNGERFPKDILNFKREGRLLSSQKPVALLEYLIKTYTNKGDTVLDNCMGSGSTGVACVNTGRNFIGIELDEGYFKIASNRIKKAVETKGVEKS